MVTEAIIFRNQPPIINLMSDVSPVCGSSSRTIDSLTLLSDDVFISLVSSVIRNIPILPINR